MMKQKIEPIFPFFWQCGAGKENIRTELEKIYESHLKAFCVEARPHPDFGGPGWWEDMDLIMNFAREHGMQVWLLDDDRFPTGHANKAFSDGKNPLSARFLTVHNTDICGSLSPGYLLVKSILQDDDTLVGVLACRRKDSDSTELIWDTFVDVTDRVQNGWLKWEVPEGLWRILVFYTTRHGNGKLDYFNILDSRSVKLLIDRVYEPHYEHYGADFGNTFQGFFSDEPEFSNLPGYRFQARLGEDMPYIPWSDELEIRLRRRWKREFLSYLSALWYQIGEKTPHIRYEYMDAVTRQLSVSFSGQIGDWCREHGVWHIGHIVEDDNSHGRLGCSTGHYFRSLGDMRMAGIDVVTQQIMPGMDQGEHQWVASSRDGEFFHYGLAKLGSSLAHIDRKKEGDSLCEIFGAYGWQEGVGLMKWLADHMVSRGINHFVPHAFSVKPYPDPDCPPHFYAHGNHAQFACFGTLMTYLERIAGMFQGGRYPADVAVLYHADSEWAGKAMLFQKPMRVLLENQMDADIVPADLFAEENPYGMKEASLSGSYSGICVAEQRYRTLIIPGCEFLPASVAKFLIHSKDKMQILFVDNLPTGICEETEEEEWMIEQLSGFEVVSLAELPGRIRETRKPLVEVNGTFPWLRTYPYWDSDGTLKLFCFNESTKKKFQGELSVHSEKTGDYLYLYDAMRDCYYRTFQQKQTGEVRFKLCLNPGESKILVWREQEIKEAVQEPNLDGSGFPLSGHWKITAQNIGEETDQLLLERKEGEKFPDLTEWAARTEFNGTLIYQTAVTVSKEAAGRYLMILNGRIDCAEILVDGKVADRLVGNSGYAKISLKPGFNQIEIRLPLTPVWKDGDIWSALTMLPRRDLTEIPVLLPE